VHTWMLRAEAEECRLLAPEFAGGRERMILTRMARAFEDLYVEDERQERAINLPSLAMCGTALIGSAAAAQRKGPDPDRSASAAPSPQMTTEKAHWLGRRTASLKMAESAACSEARLIHYDLAGRYGVKAMSAETLAIDLANS
jgi:hypothetical protein